jgi:isoleucyl-tRNA synthetase
MNTSNNNNKKSFVAQQEESVLDFWHTHEIFKKSLTKDAPQGSFVFYDGPPFATGLPHYGHLLAGTIKDVIPRYKTMKGYHVSRTWGWDCHGLPLENLVEKELNLETKKDVEEYGIEKFNQAARDAVLRYEEEWKRYVPRLGRWIDMDQPYMSMHSSYMESVWWIFSQLHKKDLTKQGFKPMHLCPRCETTLANFEVNQGYQDVTDISLTAKFELRDQPGTFFLAWTTTPWTLPGNVALAVHTETQYAYVQEKEDTSQYIVASDLVESVFEGKEYEIVHTCLGADLVGKEYVPAFDYYQQQEEKTTGWKVYAADFVTTEDGTGIVHIAPAFGSDDMHLGDTCDLPFVQHVNTQGAFNDDFAQTIDGASFKGMKVKKKGDLMTTDIEIIKYLAHDGKLFSKKKLVHSYPHCWRCDTPLLNYATSSWFVDVPQIKDRLVALNSKVNWVPDHVGDGRFGKWLDGARDWALSRARFWGTPLPVWNSEDGTETLVCSSVETLLDHVVSSNNEYLGLRHGESESNVTGIINADVNTSNGLTDKGREQVLAASPSLQDKKIDYVFVSPFQRTQETVEILKQELHLSDDQIITDERLGERKPGSLWEGKLWVDAHIQEEKQSEPAFWNYRLTDDAESIADVYKRSVEFLFDIEQRYSDATILIVSHGGVLKTLQFASTHYGDERKAHDFYEHTMLPDNAQLIPIPFKPFPHNRDMVLDLHRPYLDEVKVVSEKGTELKLLGDVFDVWFDSGSMPYAQVHYPFEHADTFREERFPAQFIAEGLDQTRGWFYVLSVLGTALFDTFPYENVVVNGLVLAEDGKKMSKSLKNYPDPYDVFDSLGADATRLYLLHSPVVRGEEFAFNEKSVKEVGNKVMMRMRNIMKLFETYADDAYTHQDIQSQQVLDQWIQARVHQTAALVEDGLESYELDRAVRPLFDFVDDFSTWYIRRSRDRFKSEDTEDREQALATTKMVLQKTAQILAPFTPFVAEELWQSLRKYDDSLEESVHLSLWPQQQELSEEEHTIVSTMKKVRDTISEGLQLRADHGIKVRQPLQSLTASLAGISSEYHDLIKDELNVKELHDGELQLDTHITQALQDEGDVREILRQLQSLRKKHKLEVHDVISLTMSTSDETRTLIQEAEDHIKEVANIKTITYADIDGELIEAGDHKVYVGIE